MTQLIYTITLLNDDGTEASASMPVRQIADVPSCELQRAADELRDRMLSLGQHIQNSMQSTAKNLPIVTNGNGRRAKAAGVRR